MRSLKGIAGPRSSTIRTECVFFFVFVTFVSIDVHYYTCITKTLSVWTKIGKTERKQATMSINGAPQCIST